MRLDKGVVLTGIDAVDELIHLAFCLFCMAYISYNSLADMFITALKKLTFLRGEVILRKFKQNLIFVFLILFYNNSVL